MEIDKLSLIDDFRDMSDFKGITFSKCSKLEVKK